MTNIDFSTTRDGGESSLATVIERVLDVVGAARGEVAECNF